MSSVGIEFLGVFIPLFVVVDPFGSLLVFITLTAEMPQKQKRRITVDAIIYGFLILLFFALLGKLILFFFGISIQALEIAGGIILLIMGVQMVREGDKPKSTGGAQKEEHEDVGIVPLATPMLAGPGAISLVIILMNGTELARAFTIASIAILFGIVLVFFIFSSRIVGFVGGRTMKAVTRVFGLLVAAFAIQFFLNVIAFYGFIPVSG